MNSAAHVLGRYAYTAVGSRATVTLPNHTVTTYLYDSLKRLTNLTHKTSGGTTLASAGYVEGSVLVIDKCC